MGLLRELYRRFRLACHKPEHWQFRPDTFDRRAFRDVAIDNEYQLPRRFASDDVLLDVGAHVGSFAFAALRRGAGLVYCCEPEPANFRQLRHNLRPYGERVRLIQCAVWRSDVDVPALALHNPQPRNTGGFQVTTEPDFPTVEVQPFDDLVAAITSDGQRIRLLKLDCEGAEWPILLTARTLDRIDAICGEYHLWEHPEVFHVSGFPTMYTPEVLASFLRKQGFHVTVQPHPRSPQPIGNFFAHRSDPYRTSRQGSEKAEFHSA
jgi:FkbM family methyltransferase